MFINRGHVYLACPSEVQREALAQTVGVARLVYNLALEQRRDHWRAYSRQSDGRRFNDVSQSKELTALRAAYPWIKAVSVTVQQQALRDLEKTFKAFFAGRARYPNFRKKGLNDSARFQGRECEVRVINAKWADVFLSKIGWVRFRLTRPLSGVVKNVTVTQRLGEFFLAFSCESEIFDPPSHAGDVVGIDLGVAASLTLSTGEVFSLPVERLNVLDRRRRRAQKNAARGVRGSNRNRRAKRKVATISSKIARVRRHWQHETTTALAERFSVVVMEDLKIRNMTASAKGTVEEPGRNVRQKAGLNRAILNQGWGEIGRQLDYKLTARSGYLEQVDPRHSSQTCSVCDHRAAENRKSQAVFVCVLCGSTMNADHNAAKVIVSRWITPALDAEGSGGKPPCEASTERLAA